MICCIFYLIILEKMYMYMKIRNYFLPSTSNPGAKLGNSPPKSPPNPPAPAAKVGNSPAPNVGNSPPAGNVKSPPKPPAPGAKVPPKPPAPPKPPKEPPLAISSSEMS